MEFSHTYIAEYVRRAQNGDSDAFAELYNMTFNKVYNYTRHYLRDDYLAQDAVQEIFVSALKNIKKLNDPTLFVAWLNQISFHVCFDMAKAHKSDYGEADPELLEEVCDTKRTTNPEASALDRDESKRLFEAIDNLSVSERELVTLRYFNSMKIDDIVSATGISRSTVKRQLAAAVSKLKNLMNG